MKKQERYINRELSWLDFNGRVLQEAADPDVPLLERLRFIGIFSNNLDEFFQVRFATVQRIAQSEKSGKNIFGGLTASDLLKTITQKVIKQQKESTQILSSIEVELEKEEIYFINESEVLKEHETFLKEYFIQKVSPSLMTIIVSEDDNQDFSDNNAFLAVKLIFDEKKEIKTQFALIELPTDLDRFIVLPSINNKKYVMFLDDLIRYHFHIIFNFFEYTHIESHMIKVTRDAELDMEGDVSKSYINKIVKSVRDRFLAEPVRLVHDKDISKEAINMVKKILGVGTNDSLIPGGRYHHRRDYMNFPQLNRSDLQYERKEALPINGLSLEKSIFKAIKQKDYLIYTPYHSFSFVIKFLREAALDPEVTIIKITIYRLSRLSNVASSLINAAKNGKKVLVQIELQARFDETNNIIYAEQMQAAGVELIFGIPGLKVHSKICVIEKSTQGKKRRYGFISTGNFNEDTAKVYTDYTLFTSNQKVLKEVNKVFNFLQVHYKLKAYKHLIVSPHHTHNALVKMINKEIENHKIGLPSGIRLKLNAITNFSIIEKLYQASNEGVKIQMVVRGICCLIPGIKGMSENIEVLSVVDKFLEHPRVYEFINGGSLITYISSADFMTRNIENRLEVAAPIYDPELQRQIKDVFDIIWNDNVKARRLNGPIQNNFVKNNSKPNRSQFKIYEYYKKEVDQ
ncbi:polyphosphate kinase 1 [Lacinutrix sp.]|uniref:polyphosphate kinase 1 n=1 Tax=Lacinutrix sp. TaxID=1937692 RepID=UPI00260E37FF|nr:polyphosphate kinase 1 [Lacinutrix sp.]MDG1251398.1 polyphosphate kinase 1 [Flavobacteriaceae bacterium]MDG1715404.1 polyphosphate kinase 1 [Lacinutrix sp.]|tara:strand:- start:2954 stop:5011 length:2058 start_codon:yes stop_codon:yes gene_type:complete